MRIKITLSADKSGIIDFNYQHQIQAVIYEFLSKSDRDYSSWLHEQGYVHKNDKRFKFFVFSGIAFHKQIKIIRSNNVTSQDKIGKPPLDPLLAKEGNKGWSKSVGIPLSVKQPSNSSSDLNGFSFKASQIDPFFFSFQIASPVDKFIQHLIDGIFREGNEITLGRQKVTIYRIETLPDPLSSSNGSNSLNGLISLISLISLTLRPLESPIFIKKPMPSGQRDIYLFPGDEGYAEFLNQNLLHKHETLYGKPFEGEPLKFDFRLERFEQLERFKPKLFKSFKVFKDGDIIGEIKGTLQPFTVTGPKELIKIGLECGFGQNNSMGCGYVEVA